LIAGPQRDAFQAPNSTDSSAEDFVELTPGRTKSHGLAWFEWERIVKSEILPTSASRALTEVARRENPGVGKFRETLREKKPR